jgi:hypothetical protein
MRIYLPILLGIFSASPCLAGAGAEPFDFLFLDANARAVGMGGAYTAMATDANALLYNPAGLAKVARSEATFMHNMYFQGITQEYAAYASPKGWSANLNYLSFGSVQKTTLSDPDGISTGQTTLRDMAFTAGYGCNLLGALSLGVGAKFIREVIDSFALTGYALDLGALYEIKSFNGLRVGAALQNIGPPARSVTAKENLPLNLRVGLGYEFKVLGIPGAVALDAAKERSQKTLPALGGEVRPLKPLAVRVGYNSRNKAGTGVTAGVGFLFKDGSIDYGFVPYGDLGNSHRISVTLRWGGKK